MKVNQENPSILKIKVLTGWEKKNRLYQDFQDLGMGKINTNREIPQSGING